MQRTPTDDNESKSVSDLPAEFKIFISHKITEPNEKDATWVLTPFKLANLEISVLLEHHLCKKMVDKFDILYFKFECPVGCKFKFEVSFPEEDKMIAHRNSIYLIKK